MKERERFVIALAITIIVVAFLIGSYYGSGVELAPKSKVDRSVIDESSVSQIYEAINFENTIVSDDWSQDEGKTKPPKNPKEAPIPIEPPEGPCVGQIILVRTAQDLDDVRKDLDGNYMQVADIDLSSYPNWKPIYDCGNDGSCNSPDDVKFTGCYNGNGFKIYNLTHSSLEEALFVGLFGKVQNSVIKNVHLRNVNIQSYWGTGSLVGHQDKGSEIRDSSSEGTVTILCGDYVSCQSASGGLVGTNNGDIIDSRFDGDVIASGSSGFLSVGWVGGLVGWNTAYQSQGQIVGSHSSGNVFAGQHLGGLVGHQGSLDGVNSPVIINSSSNSNVYGGMYVGGLIGYSHHSLISGCYSEGDVEGNSSVGGLIGYYHAYSDLRDCYSGANATSYGWRDWTNTPAGGLFGSVCGSDFFNSYAMGKVESVNIAGGLVGRKEWPDCEQTAFHSYWDIETTGQSWSFMGQGRTTDEMTSVPRPDNTYVDWDFTNVWDQTDGDYPSLR